MYNQPLISVSEPQPYFTELQNPLDPRAERKTKQRRNTFIHVSVFLIFDHLTKGYLGQIGC